MKRTVLERIDDMLEMIGAIRTIDRAASGPETEMIHRLATERAFAILSEASRHIPEETKRLEPNIPWRDIAGIGNVLRHDYQAVSEETMRQAAADDIDTLEAAPLRLKAMIVGA